jgi:hypothetical protein
MSGKRLCPTLGMFLFFAIGLSGCSTDQKPSESEGAATRRPSSRPNETLGLSGPTADSRPAVDKKPASPAEDIKVDLPAILGSKRDGWSPKVISRLKRGMTPEEAAKAFPGADKVDKFGFVGVPILGHPELEEIRLYFAKGKDGVPKELQSVKLSFQSALNSDTFWDQLSKACIERYGKADEKELAKRLITWVGPRSGMAQLMKGLTENHGFTLDITLQR